MSNLPILAPHAVPYIGRLGRSVPETEDPVRTPFQRDRARIIHSQAFRRLQGKTQVFVVGDGDHYRTRLTHTMEVAQIARDIARTLQLNEDLTECIGLAHDLGHPPFGHSGEAALNEYMHTHGGSFEHNRQSYRIVTLLERHISTIPGLNLTVEVLEGLMKHEQLPHGRTLEAQVADKADEIAYLSHDTDDGLRAGMFSMVELKTVPLAARAYDRAAARGTQIRGALIELFVQDLFTETMKRLERANCKTIDDVYAFSSSCVAFSDALHEDMRVFRRFLASHLFEHPSIRQTNLQGQKILKDLAAHYETSLPEKILLLQQKTASTLPEAICDYIAGMTDSFAIAQRDALIAGK